MSLVDLALRLYQYLNTGEYTWSEMLVLISEILKQISILFPEQPITVACELTEEECMERLAKLDASAAWVTDEAEPKLDPSIWVPIIIKLIELWLSRR